MTWHVFFTERFWRDVKSTLKGLPRAERERIISKLDELATALSVTAYPVHLFDLRRVAGRNFVEIRVRMGKYRVIYRVFKGERKIVLTDFFRRDDRSYSRRMRRGYHSMLIA